jgi:hypothetical protein
MRICRCVEWRERSSVDGAGNNAVGDAEYALIGSLDCGAPIYCNGTSSIERRGYFIRINDIGTESNGARFVSTCILVYGGATGDYEDFAGRGA